MSLYLSEAPRQDTVADWTLLSLDQLGRILISLVGVGRRSAMNNIASVLLPFYGLCILLNEHGLRIVSKRWILLESEDSASYSLFWLYPLRPLYLINWTRPKCCVKKINSLASIARCKNFLFSLGILRALYLILSQTIDSSLQWSFGLFLLDWDLGQYGRLS